MINIQSPPELLTYVPMTRPNYSSFQLEAYNKGKLPIGQLIGRLILCLCSQWLIDNSINNSDPFAYIITSWYIPNKFYGIMINTGSITINTPIGRIKFHIVEADIPFLLYLIDMDSLGVFIITSQMSLSPQSD
jgi:hypothetical protein